MYNRWNCIKIQWICKSKKKTINNPELTKVIITPVESLQAPLEVGTKVADLSAEGGTSPYTFTLKNDTGDNAEFQINNSEVQVKTKIEVGENKNITVIATDSKGKTKEATSEIEIAVASV